MLAYLGVTSAAARLDGPRRRRDDLGRLASAARRDVDRRGDARLAGRRRDPHWRAHGVRLYARRPRRLHRKRQLGRLRHLGGPFLDPLQQPQPPVHVVDARSGAGGAPARGSLRARPRQRHLPPLLDAEHHAPPLDRHQAGAQRRRHRRGRRLSHRARNVVARAARPPERPHEHECLRRRGDRPGRVRVVRARRRRCDRGAVAANGSGAARRVRGLRRRARVHGQLATAAAALACQDDLACAGRERPEPEPGPGDQPVRQRQERTPARGRRGPLRSRKVRRSLHSYTRLRAAARAQRTHVHDRPLPASEPFLGAPGRRFAIVAGIGAALVLLAGWWTHRRIA